MADREALIEAVVGAYRPEDPDGRIKSAPAFYDLSVEDRRIAFDAATRQRTLEAALDREGLSTTAHAVLARIRGG